MAWLTPPKSRTWWTEMPDLRGMAAYVVYIRDKDDPERAPRPGLLRDPGHATRWKEMNRQPPDEWRKVIVNLLADGIPRTFNRIMVELIGVTADTAAGKNPEKGLWLGVEDGYLEYSREAPILFRIRSRRQKTKPSRAPAPPPATPPKKPARPKKQISMRRVTAREILSPEATPEDRLATSVSEAIRLYGGKKKP